MQIELNTRIEAANSAQATKNPAIIAQANEKVIPVALRMMGRLRLLEHAYNPAVALYQEAASFEDLPEAHFGAAVAALQAQKPDIAVAEAQKAVAAEPKSERNNRLLGQAYLDKQEFRKAAEAYQKAIQIRPAVENYYSLAIAWLAMGNAEGKAHAQEVFRTMEKLFGDSGSLHVLFGRAYRDANQMPDAIHEFERAIALDPTAPHAHYFLGLAHLSVNEWKATPEVEAQFKEEIRYHPKDFLANYMLGNIASSERDYPTAEKYLKAAMEIDPTWPEPYLYLGLNAYAQGDAKIAEPLLRKAVELTGNDESRSNYQIRRAYIDLGRILSNTGREQESDAFLAKARELQNKVMTDTQQRAAAMLSAESGGAAVPGVVPLDKQQEKQASLMLTGGGAASAAVDAFTLQQAKLTPDQLTAVKEQEEGLRRILGQSLSDLATCEAMQHNYTGALGHYQEAARWDAEIADLDKNLGLAAFRAKDYSDAAPALARAVAANPDAIPLRAMLGISYYAMEKYGDAATAFYPLGYAGMDDSEVGYAWAASLAKAGDLKHASEVLTHYQALNLPGDAMLLAGELWIEIGDYGNAVAELHRALDANATLLRAHYYAGLADIRWGHWADARTELEAERKLAPNDPDALYELGFVDLQESKSDDAAKLFEQVIAAHPDYANAQYELGKILVNRGQLQQAVPHLEAAARLNPDKDYVHYELQAAYRKESRVSDADRELAVYQELKAKSRPHLPQSPAQAPTQNP